MRTFRQSLLCHAEVAVRPEPQLADLHGLFVSCRLEAPHDLSLVSEAPADFAYSPVIGSGPVLRTDHPLTKAALAILAERAPSAIEFQALCQAASARLGSPEVRENADSEILAKFLLRASAESPQALSLHAYAPAVANSPSLLPTARGFARRQVARGDELTTLFHDSFSVEPLCRALLPLLDGTRDVAALTAALHSLSQTGRLALPEDSAGPLGSAPDETPLADDVRDQLAALARLGVLLS